MNGKATLSYSKIIPGNSNVTISTSAEYSFSMAGKTTAILVNNYGTMYGPAATLVHPFSVSELPISNVDFMSAGMYGQNYGTTSGVYFRRSITMANDIISISDYVISVHNNKYSVDSGSFMRIYDISVITY